MIEQILILDFGSQYTQVIARRVRECNVYSTILRYDTPAAEIAKLAPKGIILSGGPSSVYAADAPLPDKEIFKLGVPMLGICYGVQLLRPLPRRQGRERPEARIRQGHARRERHRSCALFAKLPRQLQVWNSHGDKLTKPAQGLRGCGHGEFRIRRD
jgi:GMP synthase (glutamine-hydrolysing)